MKAFDISTGLLAWFLSGSPPSCSSGAGTYRAARRLGRQPDWGSSPFLRQLERATSNLLIMAPPQKTPGSSGPPD